MGAGPLLLHGFQGQALVGRLGSSSLCLQSRLAGPCACVLNPQPALNHPHCFYIYLVLTVQYSSPSLIQKAYPLVLLLLPFSVARVSPPSLTLLRWWGWVEAHAIALLYVLCALTLSPRDPDTCALFLP